MYANDSLLDDAGACLYIGGGITPRTLRLWRNRRGLPYIRITQKVIRYKVSDLNRWLDKHRVATVVA